MNHYFKGLITGIILSITAILFSASTSSSQLGRYVLNTNPIEGSSGDLHLIDSMSGDVYVEQYTYLDKSGTYLHWVYKKITTD
tara:strand:- start:28 stop:276 length:249 start_codon:yes stop_codon:yes gene_type:complete